MKKLNRIWASLPGSPYGQPTRKTEALWQKFQQARKAYP
jgi:muramidase (phage lysozyme)